MARSDHREGASSRQDGTTVLPAIQPGGLYTKSWVKTNFGISDDTFDKWTFEFGLPVCENTGARDLPVFGDDILEMMRQFRGPRIKRTKNGE